MPNTHDLRRLFAHSVQLDPGSPAVHTAITAEYDDPCRYSHSMVLKTPLRRAGRWHGIRKSWLSVQVKLPTGERIADAVWGIVLGWWRTPRLDQEWFWLQRAIELDHTPDEDDERNFTAPTSESIGYTVIDVDRRRVAAEPDAGTDGQ